MTTTPLPSDASGVERPDRPRLQGAVGRGFPVRAGGFVCSHAFDHTSLLRFLETRFGAEVPNLSSWWRSAVGDLTSAFNFAKVDRPLPSCRIPLQPIDA